MNKNIIKNHLISLYYLLEIIKIKKINYNYKNDILYLNNSIIKYNKLYKTHKKYIDEYNKFQEDNKFKGIIKMEIGLKKINLNTKNMMLYINEQTNISISNLSILKHKQIVNIYFYLLDKEIEINKKKINDIIKPVKSLI